MDTIEILADARKKAGDALSEQLGAPEYSSAADFDARFMKMMADDERAERERQEQINQRKQMAQSLVDLGGVFTDVIKANEGALVTPRDVQSRYDALDDNTKKIYDNYRARMDVIRQNALARIKGDQEAALEARMAQQKAQAAAALEAQKANDAYNLEAMKQKNANIRNADDNNAKRYSARMSARGKAKGNNTYKQTYDLDFGGGNKIDYGQNQWAYGNTLTRAVRYLSENGLIPKDQMPKDSKGNVKPVSQWTTAERQSAWTNTIDSDRFTPEMREELYELLGGTNGHFESSQVGYDADEEAQVRSNIANMWGGNNTGYSLVGGSVVSNNGATIR